MEYTSSLWCLLLIMSKGLYIISFGHGMESFYNNFHPLSGVLWFMLSPWICRHIQANCIGVISPPSLSILFDKNLLDSKYSANSWSLFSPHWKHRRRYSYPCSWTYPSWKLNDFPKFAKFLTKNLRIKKKILGYKNYWLGKKFALMLL